MSTSVSEREQDLRSSTTVAALAWNDTIKAAIALWLSADDEVVGLLIYALIVTVIAVAATLLIAMALGKAKEALKVEEEE